MHTRHCYYKLLILLVAIGVLVGSSGVFEVANAVDVDARIRSATGPVNPGLSSLRQAEADVTTFLPMVVVGYPAPPSVFGAEINVGLVSRTIEKGREANLTWIRYNGIRWYDIEPERGELDWSKLDRVKTEMQLIRQNGMEPIVVIRGTPLWAQMDQYTGIYCSPIREDALDEFAAFVRQVVRQLKSPPYNVHYWEMGNEPDIDPYLYQNSLLLPYGCWGDENDDYYGGGYYGKMLQQAAAVIRSEDPQAKILVGGLLLDCDPNNPPAGKSCNAAKFLEGILQAGYADAFDIVAYHAFPLWFADPPNTDIDLNHPSWSHRGGVVLGKLDFIQDVLQRYNLQKPILMNEGGMVCGWESTDPFSDLCRTDSFYQTRANYVIRLYTRSWAHGLTGSVWYTLNGPGWRDGGLLDENQEPRLSYLALRYIASLLRGARYTGSLSSGMLEGYAFIKERPHLVYHIYWSNDSTVLTIPKPVGTRAVYNHFGEDITPLGDSISIGFNPITIIELQP